MNELIRKDITLAASVSCFNLYNIESQMAEVEDAGIDMLHFDVVDGHFNDCIILGTPTLEAIRPHTKLPIEVHLGVNEPEKFIEQFVKAGADYVSVHYEVMKYPKRIFDMIEAAGAKPILALRAETEVDAGIVKLLDRVGWILKLTVNPGYSGQAFQAETVEKIRRLRKAISEAGFKTGIQSDGNMNLKTVPKVISAGADMITGGTSGLFLKNKSIKEAAGELLTAARAAYRKMPDMQIRS